MIPYDSNCIYPLLKENLTKSSNFFLDFIFIFSFQFHPPDGVSDCPPMAGWLANCHVNSGSRDRIPVGQDK